MSHKIRKLIFSTGVIFLLFLILGGYRIQAQTLVSGMVISQEDGTPLEGVAVSSNSFKTGVLTDYRGRYSLKMDYEDTITFSYLGFKEQKFPVHGGWNTYYTLNVSMAVLPVLLKNFTYLQKRNFKDDSLLNRAQNQFIFNYKRATVISYALSPPSFDLDKVTYPFGYQGPQFAGGLGFSLNGFYSRFLNSSRDRYLQYKSVILAKEKEAYIQQYFNNVSVGRITGLTGEDLQYFLKHYEPKFKSLLGKSEYDIEWMIKQSYLRFKESKQAGLKMPSNMN